jgi:hypothetical protein
VAHHAAAIKIAHSKTDARSPGIRILLHLGFADYVATKRRKERKNFWTGLQDYQDAQDKILFILVIL